MDQVHISSFDPTMWKLDLALSNGRKDDFSLLNLNEIGTDREALKDVRVARRQVSDLGVAPQARQACRSSRARLQHGQRLHQALVRRHSATADNPRSGTPQHDRMDARTVARAWLEFCKTHNLTPHQVRAQSERGQAVFNDEVVKQAGRLASAAMKYAGGAATLNRELGIRVARRRITAAPFALE